METRIAIISFEHMHAGSYAHALRDMPGARLVAAAEPSRAISTRIKRDFSFIPKMYADYGKMLDKEVIDAVIITTANVDHAPVAIECTKRKKHIMCEKPLATTVRDAQRMIAAARKAGVKLMTAFPVRFSPAIQQAKRMIDSGQLGAILGGSTSNHGSMPGGWFIDKKRSGGGAVMDHTVHVADILRWILNDEAEQIYAEYATRLHKIPSDDVGQLLIRFRSGAFLSLDTSWSRPKSYSTWGDVKLDIKGEKANLSINCFPRSIHLYDDTKMKHQASAAGDNLDALMIAEFVSAIQEDREPLVTGEDGLRALEIALAAYEAGSKKKPVKLELAKV
jgi:predicted dehydrogenase